MKRFKPFFIIMAIFIFFIAIIIFASTTGIKIESYDAFVSIDSSGNMEVSETWIIDYPSGYNVRFRDIRFGKNHRNNPLTKDTLYVNDKASFENETASVTVVDLDKNEDITNGIKTGYSFNGDIDELGEKIECVPNSSECESIFINLEDTGGLNGKKAITYTYKINGAVTKYNDISELNWVFFDSNEAKIKKVRMEIKLPGDDEGIVKKEDISVWGHGTNSGFIEILDKQNILVTANNVKDTDKLELRVAFPNSLVNNIKDENYIKSDLKDKIFNYEEALALRTNNQIKYAKIVNGITILAVIVTALGAYLMYLKFDKEYVAVFQEQYLMEPPKDILPAEVGYLYNFGKASDEDVTATILDLVRRKILKINDKGVEINKIDPDFDIVLLEDYNSEELLEHERLVIDMFIKTIGNGKKVNTIDIKNYTKIYKDAQKMMKFSDSFQKAVKNEYKTRNYFENVKDKVLGKGGITIILDIIFLILTVILASRYNLGIAFNIIVLIFAIFIYSVYIGSIKRRTREGNEDYAKWKAFRNFLDDFSDFKDYPMPGIIIWEKYMVYATSLKLADKVMKQLKVKLQSMPEEYSSDATFMRGYYYGSTNSFFLYNSISSSYTSARTNAISTIAAHNAASVGGKGGGFSGGSSFGGGGGGGRSR